MSALVNGVTAHPRVQAMQHGFSSRGYGAGYDVGVRARSRFTGTGGPGSAGPIVTTPARAEHVHVGDSAGPNSPYAGKWDMGGGGHNANEFRGKLAADAGGVPDYRRTTVVEDPVTGVAIDEVTRQPVKKVGGGLVPETDATGHPKPVKSARKSIFPDNMGRPEIEAAGQRAIELALAGAPHTSHTPPATPGGNGSFEAVVTTPNGHPIVVEGHYKRNPTTGQIEVQTVYPVSDRPAGRVDPVPGSQPTVPGGIVTPPDYDYGEDD